SPVFVVLREQLRNPDRKPVPILSDLACLEKKCFECDHVVNQLVLKAESFVRVVEPADGDANRSALAQFDSAKLLPERLECIDFLNLQTVFRTPVAPVTETASRSAEEVRSVHQRRFLNHVISACADLKRPKSRYHFPQHFAPSA